MPPTATTSQKNFYSGLLDVARGSEGVGGSKCEVTKLILALFADFAFLDARRCMPVATVWRAEASQRGHMTHRRQWT